MKRDARNRQVRTEAMPKSMKREILDPRPLQEVDERFPHPRMVTVLLHPPPKDVIVADPPWSLLQGIADPAGHRDMSRGTVFRLPHPYLIALEVHILPP